VGADCFTTGAAGICMAKDGVKLVRATAAVKAAVAIFARKPSIFISIPWFGLVLKPVGVSCRECFPSKVSLPASSHIRIDDKKRGGALFSSSNPYRFKELRGAP
jgi:hypothetical protein